MIMTHCSLVGGYQRLGRTFSFHLQGTSEDKDKLLICLFLILQYFKCLILCHLIYL
jgi:hypothetical protein